VPAVEILILHGRRAARASDQTHQARSSPFIHSVVVVVVVVVAVEKKEKE
jgi:hypothetical protein